VLLPARRTTAAASRLARERGKDKCDYKQNKRRRNFLTSLPNFGEAPWWRRGEGEVDQLRRGSGGAPGFGGVCVRVEGGEEVRVGGEIGGTFYRVEGEEKEAQQCGGVEFRRWPP
jgi:hypothetical protein